VHEFLLIDVSRLIGRFSEGRLPTGVDRVCLAYIQQWGERAQAVIQRGNWRRILSHADSQRLFALLAEQPANFKRRADLLIARACLPPWPVQDAAGRISLSLGHTGLDRPGFAEWLRRTRQKPVFFLHDLIPITHPEYCRAGEQALHTQRLKVMLESGAGIVANSADTLDALANFADKVGRPLPPAVVAHLAPARLLPGVGPAPLDMPYFVVLGTLEPRKNHLLLLNAWRELAARHGAQAPHLVVIGQRGWECENVVDMLERCEPLRGLVHERTGCSDAELGAYLQHARALLFPSFAEGYGMPLVEALLLGTPVIASGLPVFREIAGEVPDYLHPLDGVSWLDAVVDYAGPASERRAAQQGRIAAFALPSWAAHFASVESLLERLQ
jgi:glycosyltransferase involved in cell wall biosynthesis